MKLKFYRHKDHDDIFLARNWQYCGGNKDTAFYYATKSIMTAISDANKADFENWMKRFPDNDGITELRAKIKDIKDVDMDGYKGTLVKELSFNVADFELVELVELSRNDERNSLMSLLHEAISRHTERIQAWMDEGAPGIIPNILETIADHLVENYISFNNALTYDKETDV